MPIPSSLRPSPCSKRFISATLHPRWASLAKSAFGAVVAVGVLAAGSAQAVGLVVRVSVGGQDWDVSTFTGSYNSNTAKFALPSSPGGVMPWWESESLASQFASAVGKGLGTQELGPGDKSPGDRLGPFFGYGASNDATRLDFDYLFALNEFVSVVQTYSGVNRGIENTKWAQAAPAAAPGPLPALGAASAFVYSRKLRNRIKASKAVSSKATTV